MSATVYDVDYAAEDPAFTVGLRIRKARRDKGWEQADLAERVGVSRQLVSKWERDVSVPDVEKAAKAADALAVSFGWLCGVPVRSRCFAPLSLVSDNPTPMLPFPPTDDDSPPLVLVTP